MSVDKRREAWNRATAKYKRDNPEMYRGLRENEQKGLDTILMLAEDPHTFDHFYPHFRKRKQSPVERMMSEIRTKTNQ